jgi:hypothetical protein
MHVLESGKVCYRIEAPPVYTAYDLWLRCNGRNQSYHKKNTKAITLPILAPG